MARAPDSSRIRLPEVQGIVPDLSAFSAALDATPTRAVYSNSSFDGPAQIESSIVIRGFADPVSEVLLLEPPELPELLAAEQAHQHCPAPLSLQAAAETASTGITSCTAAGTGLMLTSLQTVSGCGRDFAGPRGPGLFVEPPEQGLQNYSSLLAAPAAGSHLTPDSISYNTAANILDPPGLATAAAKDSCQWQSAYTSSSAAAQQTAAAFSNDLMKAGSLESSNSYASGWECSAYAAGQGAKQVSDGLPSGVCPRCHLVAASIKQCLQSSSQGSKLMPADRQQLVDAIVQASFCAQRCLLTEQLPSSAKPGDWWLSPPKARSAKRGSQRAKAGTTLARNFNWNANSPLQCCMARFGGLPQSPESASCLLPRSVDTIHRENGIKSAILPAVPVMLDSSEAKNVTMAPLYSVKSTDGSLTGVALLRPAYGSSRRQENILSAEVYSQVDQQDSITENKWVERGVTCSKPNNAMKGQVFDIYKWALFYCSQQNRGQSRKRKSSGPDSSM